MRTRLIQMCLLAFVAFAPLGGAAAMAGPQDAAADPLTGTALWHGGDPAGAEALWRAELERVPPGPERARLLYNLGVAAHAGGDPLRAVARFEGALRLAPRDADARHNLDIARADAGLEPADPGTFGAALARLAGAFTRGEAEWLALLGALLGAAALILFGAGRARAPAWVMLALCPLLLVPLGRALLSAEEDPVMVVARGGATVTAFAREGAERLGSLPAGAVVPRVETYGAEWTKIIHRGEERWVRTERVLGLLGS